MSDWKNYLHHSRSGDVIVIFISAIVRLLTVFLLSVRAPFALESLRLQRLFCDPLLAGDALGNLPLFNLTKDRITIDFVLTFDTGSSRKGSMALNHFFREYSCVSFNIINILRVIGQKLPLVLEQSNESMSR